MVFIFSMFGIKSMDRGEKSMEVRVMKKYLLLVVLFIFIGCMSLSFDPITNPDKRIVFEGLSFLPPNGENWEWRGQINPINLPSHSVSSVSSERGVFLNSRYILFSAYRYHQRPFEVYLTPGIWGRSNLQFMIFKKTIIGQKQTSDKEEIVFVSVFKYDFALMKFDHDEDLMELAQSGYLIANQIRSIKLFQPGKIAPAVVLESNLSHENFKEMNCVKDVSMLESRRGLRTKEVSEITIYIKGHVCVHPRYPNHIIVLKTRQYVLKGQTPTDIQNEIDSFFASLKFH